METTLGNKARRHKLSMRPSIFLRNLGNRDIPERIELQRGFPGPKLEKWTQTLGAWAQMTKGDTRV